jgi:hypothetical protein
MRSQAINAALGAEERRFYEQFRRAGRLPIISQIRMLWTPSSCPNSPA